MRIHELKIRKEYFDDIKLGKKKFEIRRNDREYKVGDCLALNEVIEKDNILEYTDNSLLVKIIYIFRDEEEIYLDRDYVILGIEQIYL